MFNIVIEETKLFMNSFSENSTINNLQVFASKIMLLIFNIFKVLKLSIYKRNLLCFNCVMRMVTEKRLMKVCVWNGALHKCENWVLNE